ncbi:MAG: oligosaccharide flippase family protein [Armatimonadota bacterium]|nr:oligosaccharide flippase family protein [bacterium]
MSSAVDFIRRALPKERFTRGVMVLAGGSFSSQVLLAIVTPITTRLYSPSDFGVLAVYTSIAAMLSLISSGRYELSIPICENNATAANVLALSIIINSLSAIAVMIAVWLCGDYFLEHIQATNLRRYLWLLPVSMIFTGTYQVFSYFAVRNKKFSDLARTKLSQSICANAIVLGLGLLKVGPIGLLLGLLASGSSGITTLARPLLREYRDCLKSISWSEMRRLLSLYRKFPLMSAPSALLNNAACSLPAIILAAYYGNKVAGLFGLSMKMVGIPGMLLCLAVSQAYLGEIAEATRENPEQVPRIFTSVTKKMLKVSLLVVAFGCISPYIFGVIFGQTWKAAGIYSALLCFYAAAQLVVSPTSMVVVVMERQDLQMLGDFVRCVLVLASLIIPYKLHLSADVAIASYSAIMVLTYVGYYMIYKWVAFSSQRLIAARKTE